MRVVDGIRYTPRTQTHFTQPHFVWPRPGRSYGCGRELFYLIRAGPDCSAKSAVLRNQPRLVSGLSYSPALAPAEGAALPSHPGEGSARAVASPGDAHAAIRRRKVGTLKSAGISARG